MTDFAKIEKDQKKHTEISILRKIITDTLWMARRYAEGKAAFVVDNVNKSIDRALKQGVRITEDPVSNKMYAADDEGREWDSKLQNFKKRMD